jgi:GT2 family glycosyltransferase
MHRSGTSALARLLNLFGVKLGNDLLPAAADNELGFWEHRQIQFIHERIYETLGRQWINLSPFPAGWENQKEIVPFRQQLIEAIRQEFSEAPLWGVKDPRMSVMLPLWLPMLRDLHCQSKCILIFRNPVEVARSLAKRDGLLPARCYLLWLDNLRQCVRGSAGLPRSITTYDRLLNNPLAELERIGEDLKISWPVPPENVHTQVADFLRPHLRHQRIADEGFRIDASIPELVRECYGAAVQAAAADSVEPLEKILPVIDQELDNSQLLKNFIADLEKEHRSTIIAKNLQAIQLNSKANAAEQRVRKLETEKSFPNQLRDEISRQQTSINTLNNTIAQQAAELSSVQQERTTLASELKATQENLAALHRTQIENQERLTTLTRDVQRLENDVSMAVRTRDLLGAQLRSFFASAAWSISRPIRLLAQWEGKSNRSTTDLLPLTPAHLNANGQWEGVGMPQFFVPISPVRGWVRVCAKVTSSFTGRSCLYFDTGHSFHELECAELGQIMGETRVERMVYFPKPVFAVRFDPIQRFGQFTVSDFSWEPRSRFGIYISALLGNMGGLLGGKLDHRPSIWIALKLLFSLDYKTFRKQLFSNVEGESSRAGKKYSEYELWRKAREITPALKQQMQQQIQSWENPPLISVIVPVYNTPKEYLRRCIDSVVNQSYPHWELCIADDASKDPIVRQILEEYAHRDPRIKIKYREKNGNISAASNSALEIATGQYVALLDHDDELATHALFTMAEAIMRDPSLDMIYSDEDKINLEGKHVDPFFKPDWSPEYFLACMYTCHLGVYRTELLRRIGGWRSEFDQAQDYDLVLRVMAQKPRILHIPDVLYHWRAIPTSTASGPGAKPIAHERARCALQNYLQLTGREGKVEQGPSEGFHRVRYAIQGNPKVSIIIPTAARLISLQGQQTWWALECVRSIRELSTYKNLEIIVLEDAPVDELFARLQPFDVKRVSVKDPFNFSRKINLGAQASSGEHLILLNDDTDVVTPDWVESMLEYSQWPEIGAVGAKLLFPDGSQQHTGVTILEGNPGHAFYQFPGDHPGYFFSSKVHRNWSAVTAACMMTRKNVFNQVGGFNEAFPLNYNDVDYCLRVREAGLRIVLIPDAQLYHHESVSKSGTYEHELEAFKKIWKHRIDNDPYYNINLSVRGDFGIQI